ncbi:MAG: type I restriction enzyme HsdR N-terminal domain-containing protein [Flavobacteriales bacterium]
MDSATPPLNWPAAPLQTRHPKSGKPEVLCLARRKWVALEPEEWVRQHVLHYLSAELGYPLGCMAVEHRLQLNGMERRADIVAFTPDGTAHVLVECKAPNVPLNQEAVSQAARYNLVLNVPSLLVTNGVKHVAYGLDSDGKATPLKQLPSCPSR